MSKNRWVKLMESLGLPDSIPCYEQVYAAYSERHRYYHTIQHIDAMLAHFDSVSEYANAPAELELAIWFHDAIYKAFSKTNELDSAVWAKEFLLSNGYDPDGSESVFNLIMATLHNGQPRDLDQKLMVDIDLTILGSSPSVYDEFERNVRKEYRLIPSFIYRKKRKQILQGFLNQPSIYNTEHFKNQYEALARENIQRAIEAL